MSAWPLTYVTRPSPRQGSRSAAAGACPCPCECVRHPAWRAFRRPRRPLSRGAEPSDARSFCRQSSPERRSLLSVRHPAGSRCSSRSNVASARAFASSADLEFIRRAPFSEVPSWRSREARDDEGEQRRKQHHGGSKPPLGSRELARGIAPVGSVRRAFPFEHQTGAGLRLR
jgi:hypothetical protein